MSDPVEQAAEAICAATGSGQMFPWSTLTETERDAWRRMARAAIDALGLTEEEGCFITMPPADGRVRLEQVAHSDRVREIAEANPERFELVKRWVSPWVVVEHPQDRSE